MSHVTLVNKVCATLSATLSVTNFKITHSENKETALEISVLQPQWETAVQTPL